ncbi:MAG: hypothetical protein J0I20_33975 [Chloroflexi bacterium]|nr:hypothetical protein [Chloroflexota bacterium]
MQTAKDLSLRFQAVDYNGNKIGDPLDCPVIYTGGLEGNTTDLYSEKFALNFLELAPPSITELTSNTVNTNFFSTAANSLGYQYKTGPTGTWNVANVGNGPIGALLYDQSGDLWYGNSNTQAKVANRSGTVNQAISYSPIPAASQVSTIIQAPNQDIYIGGNFDTPQSYVMKYSGGTFQSAGPTTPPNGAVSSMVMDNYGNIYIASLSSGFSSPSGHFAKMTGTTWSSVGTGTTGSVRCMVKGPDGFIYLAGTFSSFGGVSANNIVKYDPVSFNFTALGSGITGGGGAIWSIGFLPDGRLIAAGDFTTAGGQTAKNIAIWNGTSWSALGPGLNGIVRTLTIDPVNGDVYVFGLFTQTGDNTYPISPTAVKWNGSIYTPFDISSSGGSTGFSQSAFRVSDKELALAVNASLTLNYSGVTTINYTGTADCFPLIKFTGFCQPVFIANSTTKKVLYFNNYYCQPGEIAYLQAGGPNGVSFTSNFPQANSNILNKLLGGSDMSAFSLVPGVNNIVVFVLSFISPGKIELIYKNTHWGFEAGA